MLFSGELPDGPRGYMAPFQNILCSYFIKDEVIQSFTIKKSRKEKCKNLMFLIVVLISIITSLMFTLLLNFSKEEKEKNLKRRKRFFLCPQ